MLLSATSARQLQKDLGFSLGWSYGQETLTSVCEALDWVYEACRRLNGLQGAQEGLHPHSESLLDRPSGVDSHSISQGSHRVSADSAAVEAATQVYPEDRQSAAVAPTKVSATSGKETATARLQSASYEICESKTQSVEGLLKKVEAPLHFDEDSISSSGGNSTHDRCKRALLLRTLESFLSSRKLKKRPVGSPYPRCARPNLKFPHAFT